MSKVVKKESRKAVAASTVGSAMVAVREVGSVVAMLGEEELWLLERIQKRIRSCRQDLPVRSAEVRHVVVAQAPGLELHGWSSGYMTT